MGSTQLQQRWSKLRNLCLGLYSGSPRLNKLIHMYVCTHLQIMMSATQRPLPRVLMGGTTQARVEHLHTVLEHKPQDTRIQINICFSICQTTYYAAVPLCRVRICHDLVGAFQCDRARAELRRVRSLLPLLHTQTGQLVAVWRCGAA